MTLSELCIRRPVLATVLNLIIILFGVISYQRLSVREYPHIDIPIVTVETTYVGADPEIIESQITKPFEDSISGIEGIDFMTSISRSELSQITITFKLGVDINAAVGDVRDRVSRVRNRIPDVAKEPVISKVEADAQPIIYLAFTSESLSPLDVTDIAERLVKDRIQTLTGVADVQIFAERRYTMRLWLDPIKLAAYGLTAQDVEQAVAQQNIEVPSGRIESQLREYTVLSATDINTPKAFENIVLKNKDNYLVKVSDVARVDISPQEERQLARYNGKNAIALGIIKQSTANPLDISRELRALLPTIKQSLPESVNVEVAYDSALFIEYSIKGVFHTIIEAVILVTGVIFLFLRSFRATLIPLVTIPVSLIGTFGIMYLFGFSINTLTLLALVLAIGLVVDDAIVVLENLYRHMEAGESRLQASLTGSREIAFAVISMTLTLAAVFTPIAFSTGRTGKLFIEFALTLAGAVLVSGFAALTLSPMMCSKLLKKEKNHESKLKLKYHTLLKKVLVNRKKMLLLIGGSFLLLAGLFLSFNSELAPLEDQGFIIGIGIGPEGATIDYSNLYAEQMEAIYKKDPDVARYFIAIGFPTVNQIISFVGLKLWEDRKRSQLEIAESFGPPLFMIPGIMAFPVNPPSLGQSAHQQSVEVVLKTTGSYDDLNKMTLKVMDKIRASNLVQNLDTDLKLNTPQLKISVDRDKIAQSNTTVDAVAHTLQTMIGGLQVTRFKRNNEQYDVIIQNIRPWRSNPDDLKQLYIRNTNNQMIPLSNLATIQETATPQGLNHFDKERAAKITGNLAPGRTLEEALNNIETIIKNNTPVGTQVDYSGVSREFRESKTTIYFIFALALCFIYLVLAAQFESFRDPLMILFSVPLALVGALLTLKITGGTLNIYTQIGLITLVGLITKHGILIVEFSNQLQEKGYKPIDAVLEAATLRLRPILMTTGAMVLGAVPLAFASGAGAISRNQIGWIIIGGLLVGTLFTLFVVPTVYSYLSRSREPENAE